MKRKVLLTLTSIAMCASSIAALVACGGSDHEEHEYTWTVQIAPTCTEKGVELGVCSCGDEITRPIEALGHHYVWTDKTDADCTHAATEEGVCDRDGCTEATEGHVTTRDKEGSEALGHSLVWQTEHAATCTTAETGHEYCTREGCDYVGATTTKGEPNGHNYTWVTLTEADCEHDRVEFGTCQDCDEGTTGHTTTRTVAGTATGHDYPDEWDITPPENNETGLAVKVCANDETHRQEVVLPKLADLVKYDSFEVDSEGVEIEGQTYFTYTLTISSEYGEITFEVLHAVCPEGQHQPGSWQTMTSATCTEDGLRIKLCTVCELPLEEEVIPAHGHLYGDWTLTLPTAETAGSAVRVCIYDKTHTETVTLPKLTETSAYTIVTTNAGKVLYGYKTYTLKANEDISFIVTDENAPGAWLALAEAALNQRDQFIGGTFSTQSSAETVSYVYDFGENYTHLTVLDPDSAFYGREVWLHTDPKTGELVSAKYVNLMNQKVSVTDAKQLAELANYYDGMYRNMTGVSIRAYGAEQYLVALLSQAGHNVNVEDTVKVNGNNYEFSYPIVAAKGTYTVTVNFTLDDDVLTSLNITVAYKTTATTTTTIYSFAPALKTDDNEYPVDPDYFVSKEQSFKVLVSGEALEAGDASIELKYNTYTTYTLTDMDGKSLADTPSIVLTDSDGKQLDPADALFSGKGLYVYVDASSLAMRAYSCEEFTVALTYLGYTEEIHVTVPKQASSSISAQVNAYNKDTNAYVYAAADTATVYVGVPLTFKGVPSGNVATTDQRYTAALTSGDSSAQVEFVEASEAYVFTATKTGEYVVTLTATLGGKTTTLTITVAATPDLDAVLSGSYVSVDGSKKAVFENNTVVLTEGTKSATFNYSVSAENKIVLTYISGTPELKDTHSIAFTDVYSLIFNVKDSFGATASTPLIKDETEAVASALEGTLWRIRDKVNGIGYVLEFTEGKLEVYSVDADYLRSDKIATVSYNVKLDGVEGYVLEANNDLFDLSESNVITYANGEITQLSLYVVENGKTYNYKLEPYDESVPDFDPSAVLAGTSWHANGANSMMLSGIYSHDLVFTSDTAGYVVTPVVKSNGSLVATYRVEFTYALNQVEGKKYSFVFTKVSASPSEAAFNCATASGGSSVVTFDENGKITDLQIMFSSMGGGLKTMTQLLPSDALRGTEWYTSGTASMVNNAFGTKIVFDADKQSGSLNTVLAGSATDYSVEFTYELVETDVEGKYNFVFTEVSKSDYEIVFTCDSANAGSYVIIKDGTVTELYIKFAGNMAPTKDVGLMTAFEQAVKPVTYYRNGTENDTIKIDEAHSRIEFNVGSDQWLCTYVIADTATNGQYKITLTTIYAYSSYKTFVYNGSCYVEYDFDGSPVFTFMSSNGSTKHTYKLPPVYVGEDNGYAYSMTISDGKMVFTNSYDETYVFDFEIASTPDANGHYALTLTIIEEESDGDYIFYDYNFEGAYVTYDASGNMTLYVYNIQDDEKLEAFGLTKEIVVGTPLEISVPVGGQSGRDIYFEVSANGTYTFTLTFADDDEGYSSSLQYSLMIDGNWNTAIAFESGVAQCELSAGKHVITILASGRGSEAAKVTITVTDSDSTEEPEEPEEPEETEVSNFQCYESGVKIELSESDSTLKLSGYLYSSDTSDWDPHNFSWNFSYEIGSAIADIDGAYELNLTYIPEGSDSLADFEANYSTEGAYVIMDGDKIVSIFLINWQDDKEEFAYTTGPVDLELDTPAEIYVPASYTEAEAYFTCSAEGTYTITINPGPAGYQSMFMIYFGMDNSAPHVELSAENNFTGEVSLTKKDYTMYIMQDGSFSATVNITISAKN